MNQDLKIKKKIRLLIILFIVGLLISGITAFPLETELSILNDNVSSFPQFMQSWISSIYFAVKTTNQNFPYLSYGTDWLAFAHIVIAVAFIGPLRDPVKNIWVIEFGIISCFMIFPLAFIAGHIRHIPIFWRLIDCSFGIIGLIILLPCYNYIKSLSKSSK